MSRFQSPDNFLKIRTATKTAFSEFILLRLKQKAVELFRSLIAKDRFADRPIRLRWHFDNGRLANRHFVSIITFLRPAPPRCATYNFQLESHKRGGEGGNENTPARHWNRTIPGLAEEEGAITTFNLQYLLDEHYTMRRICSFDC